MSTVAIEVGAVDVTADVIYGDAVFTTSAQGRPGNFHIRIKDDDHLYGFDSGARVTLDVDGGRIFDGYAWRVSHKYAFSVDDVSDVTQTPRIWELEGPDINILFTRRYVYHQADPNAELKQWPAGSHDDDVIDWLIANDLNLTGDDIDTSGVTHVGSPNPDHVGSICNIGDTWAQAMGQIASIPGAIWGLRPDRTLYYSDVNTESAAFQLSDTPSGGQVGYREFQYLEDATKMVNDAHVWGAGTFAPTITYSREQDATSIANHHRWQIGQFKYDLYHQVYVDQVADSIVQGSTLNHHGAKDPGVIVTLGIKQTGLLPGDRVRIINDVFGVNRVLPVRRMTTRFASPEDVYFELELSHEIDPPWSFAEFNWAKYRFKTHDPKCPDGGVWPDCFHVTWPPPPPPGCDCGDITDAFTRVTSGGWGVSDAGLRWANTGGAGRAYSTDGSSAIMTTTAINTTATASFAQFFPLKFEVLFDLDLTNIPPTATPQPQFRVQVQGDQAPFQVTFWPNLSLIDITGGDNPGDVGATLITPLSVRIKRENIAGSGYIYLNVWAAADPEPAGWIYTDVATGENDINTNFIMELTQRGTNTSFTATVDNLYMWLNDVLQDNCTAAQFDDFERSVSSGNWGVTNSGLTWSMFNNATQLSVTGGAGGYTALSGSRVGNAYIQADAATVVPWNVAGGFSMTSSFQVSTVPTGTDRLQLTYNVYNLSVGGQAWVDVRVSSGAAGFLTAQGMNEGVLHSVARTSWTSAQPYNIRWDYAPGATSQFKIWLASDPEPSTWDIEIDDTGPYVLAGATTMFTPVFDSIGASGRRINVQFIEFDYDGKPCYPDCSPGGVIVGFEDFERTVASGWGTATPGGQVWTVNDFGQPADVTASVTGGRGQMRVRDGEAISATASMPVTSGEWTMTSIVSPSAVPAAGDQALEVQFQFKSGATYEFFIDLLMNDTSIDDSGDGYIALFSYPSGPEIDDLSYSFAAVAYNVKVNYDGSDVYRCKVWPLGGEEPASWLLTNTGGGTPNTLEVTVTSPVGATFRTVTFDYIEFEYAGFSGDSGDGGTPVIFDNFDRANAATWGTASSGPLYSYLGVPSFGDFLISGNEGVMSIETSGLNAYFGPDGATTNIDAGPWNNPVWVFSCRLQTPNWTYTGADSSIDGTAGIEFKAGDREILLEWGTLVDPELLIQGHGWIENDDGGIIAFDWHPNTWYQLKWYYNWNTGDSWVKVWLDGTTEPGWTVTRSTYGGLGGDNQIRYFRVRSLGVFGTPWNSGNPEVVRFEDFAFTPCSPIEAGSGVSAVPPSGATGCETPSRISSIEYRTSWAYMPGTLEVYRNGTRQRPVFDYTESDTVSGFIEFTSDVATSETIYVCYAAVGAMAG